MFAILPLVFALLIANYGGQADRVSGAADLLELALSLLVWFGGCGLLGYGVARLRSTRWLPRYELVCIVSLLALHAWWCYGLGWPPLSTAGTPAPGSSVLALTPFVAGLVGLWWWLGRVTRRLTGTEVSTAGFIWLRLKLGIMPMALAVVLIDLGFYYLYPLVETLGHLPAWLGLLASGAIVCGLLIGVMILVPPVLVFLWGARRLPPGPQRELLATAISRSKVRVARILHWPTGRGRMYNAAAMGLVAPLRFVLFTDHLLDSLGDDQLRGVLGHELGHIKRGHMPLYLVFFMGASAWAWLVTPPLMALVHPVVAADLFDPLLLEGILTVGVWLVLLGVGFGRLSRDCERQADLEGVALCDDPRNMQEALAEVARLTGMDPATPSWRHHSIADRIDYLERARLDPHLARLHHRRVMKLRSYIWVFLVVGLVLIFTSSLTSRPRLEDVVAEHPELNRALLTAVETGDYDDLSRWIIGRKDQAGVSRAMYASAVLSMYHEYRLGADERRLRAYIHYLMPFRKLSTEHPALDIELQNTIAYALATGTAEPSPTDKAILSNMLPILVKHNEELKEPRYELADTIGCIHFVLGDKDAAVAEFRRARQLLKEEKDPEADVPAAKRRHPTFAEFGQLLGERIAACGREGARLPRYWNEIVVD